MQKKYLCVLVLSLFEISCASEPSLRESVSPVEARNSTPPPPPEPPGKSFDPAHRWDLSDPAAVKALSNTPFGEQEISEFWVRKGWRNTQKEDRYAARIEQLLADQTIKKTTHWALTPFTPVYATNQEITIEGVSIPKGTEFWMDTNENGDEIMLGHPLFKRMDGYKEEHQGHADQASDARDGQHRSERGK